MENQNETQFVYIKDLLFTVLYRWKLVLVVALIFALLLGCAALVTELVPTKKELEKELKARESYNTSVTVYNTLIEVYDQRITALEKSLAERQAHADDSLRMNLDPYNHYEAHVTISVQLSSTTDGIHSAISAQSLLAAYRALVKEESFLEIIGDILQQPAQYVPELISAAAPTLGTDAVTVVIKCADASTAAALVQAMGTHLQQHRDLLSQEIQPHTLTVVKSTAFAVADAALAEEQRDALNHVTEIMTGLNEVRNKRNLLELPEEPKNPMNIKSVCLFTAVGAVAGAFLTICILWAGHIVSSKVYSARTLQNRTGIKVLGCLDSGKRRTPLQKRLHKLEGRSTVTDPSLLAMDIALRTTATRLLVIGNKPLAQALKNAMPETEITLAGDPTKRAEALQALTVCDAVILTAICDATRYETISLQMEKVNDYNKQLLGCVLIDG